MKSRVRILGIDGHVSRQSYTILSERADSKGLVCVKEQRTNRELKIAQRRIIPFAVDKNKAVVIESNNKYYAVCPKCPIVFDIKPDHTDINCPDHGIHELHWLGEKPVVNTTQTTESSLSTSAQPSVAKKKKPQEPVKVDLDKIATTKDCELWSKTSIQFNHESITVISHALLYVGDNPRKMCWNTYDGTMGKKHREINIEAFVTNDEQNKSHTIYQIKDIESERKRLEKKGYTRHN
jgi:hypothetical protein